MDTDDPRLTAFALDEPTEPDVATSVAGDPDLQSEVAAVRRLALQIRKALASEPAVSLTHAQRAATIGRAQERGGRRRRPDVRAWRSRARSSASQVLSATRERLGGWFGAPREPGRPGAPGGRRLAGAIAASAAVMAMVLVAVGWRIVLTRARQAASPPAVATLVAGAGPAATESVLAGGGGGGLLAPESTPGVSFRLFDAEPAPSAATEALRNVSGQPLPSATVDAYFSRLPELSTSAAVTATFALRAGRRPPPIPGEARQQPWPPTATAVPAPQVAEQPLTVVRAAPEGDVPMATQLTVTFSEPMVPLTSHGVLAQAEVPVKLSPQPDGEWRWVGTKTLLFEASPRFPQATEYTVLVPAGTESARGAKLATDYKLTFRTPPPSVVEAYPDPPRTDQGPWADRQPLVFLRFDQRVDAAAVLGHVAAWSVGERVQLRQATQAEIAADDAVKALVDESDPGRWVAYRPTVPFLVGSGVTVQLDENLPSAEGPRPMGLPDSFGFRVYAPLRVMGPECSRPEEYGDETLPGPYPGSGGHQELSIDHCEPGTAWSIRLNNQLEPSAFAPSAFGIAPDVEGVMFAPSGADVTVQVRSAGRSKYVVTVPAGLKDVYGQVLLQPVEVTFSTGDASPALYAPGQDMLVLDPAAGGKLTLAEINNDVLKADLYRVDPSDWPAFMDFSRALDGYVYGWGSTTRPSPPWPAIWSGELQTGGQRDGLTPVDVDLAPALVDGFGQVVVLVEPLEWAPHDPYEANRPNLRWVQVTQLGLAYTGDGEKAAAWITDLISGEPVPAAEVTWRPGGGAAATGEDGLARVSGPGDCGDYGCMLVATSGGDSAFVLAEGGGRSTTRALLWYIFDDLGIYRPGETARVKGWIRPVTWGTAGDLQPPSPDEKTVSYTLRSSNGEEVAKGQADVSPAGGFDIALSLPAEMELGEATLLLDAPSGEGYHTINVAEFRRPEFEVKATAEEPYYFLGDTATLDVTAAYYSGGPLADAETTWHVAAEASPYSPPGHDGFTFGRFVPWWDMDYYAPGYRGGGQSSKEHASRTDADGRHRLAIAIDEVVPLAPASFTAQASVQDVNRQTWTSSATFTVHPARYYVGLRTDRWFAEAKSPFNVEAIVSDLDGGLVAGTPIALAAERHDWVFKAGKYVDEVVPAGGCDLVSADEPATCRLAFDQGGQYVLRATIADPEGRQNVTGLDLYVSGGQAMPLGAGADESHVQIVPDKAEYQPGDVAHLLVRSPFAPAEGLFSVGRDGMASSERFRMSGATTTIDVPIVETSIPGIGVQVTLTGTGVRQGADAAPDPSLPRAPSFASGSVQLAVPPRARTLTVEAVPRVSEAAPGASTAIDVVVRDAAGRPVPGAEVALVVADEAVLALTGYDIGDPVAAFHPQRSTSLARGEVQDFVWLADPALLAAGQAQIAAAMPQGGERGGGGGDGQLYAAVDVADAALMQRIAAAAPLPAPLTGGGGPEQAPPVLERTNMNPLALFAPRLVTDDQGHATAEFKLPDSVTRYRITAVATDGAKSFGKGESSLTARLALAVRPSAPRFLNFGDTFELAIVVQNQTDSALEADVVVRAANLRLGEGVPQGARVVVPANDRVEVRFPAAAQMPGQAVVQAAVFSGSLADAQRVTLPVWTPATTEAFATYGQIDQGAIAQPVLRPTGVVTLFGGLEMTLTSTALGNLTDAYLYLQDYESERPECVASRLMATVALEDALLAFQVPGLPDKAAIDAAVRRDLAKLAGVQGWDGGFGWSASTQYSRDSDPFVTVHVAHALARAAEKGYQPQEETISRVKDYLGRIERVLDQLQITGEPRNTIGAYAAYTRMLLGDRDTIYAREIFQRPGERDVDALGWLLDVLSGDPGSAAEVAEIRRQLNNRASEEASTAQFTTRYEEDGANVVLASDRRADAVVLEAMIADQPESPLIPKLARGLLDHRVQGRWASTQENALVLLALDRYFRAYESETPDFTARAWLGGSFAAESQFHGRSADRSETDVPLAALPAGAPEDIVLEKDGPGRLYYRLGLSYAPEDLRLEPMSRGFDVSRSYEAVDEPTDVVRGADGTYQVRAGARVRVRLAMVADSRRYHVVLVDPLPAGFEALNPDLAVTGELPEAPPSRDQEDASNWNWWWFSHWFDDQAFRDERTEAYTSLLYPGVYGFDYIARATTPGRFVAAPARAEEMYHPETFGRSASDEVVVR